MSQYTICFSPCPNDCFVFDALVHDRIALNGLKFNYHLEDVETLNNMAIAGHPDIIKLSFNAFTKLTHKYQLLDAGAALGNNCGPLLITREGVSINDLPNGVIAIPGKHTTANFLLDYVYPGLQNKKEMLFSDIENAILEGQVDAGVIIHEGRFTYEDKGLIKVADLGEVWETQTKMPIPLGGIFIKRTMPEDLKETINRLVKESVLFAMRNPMASMPFVKEHAAEMDESVMRRHIKTYVTNYSVDLGTEGRKAVRYMLERSGEEIAEPIFLSE